MARVYINADNDLIVEGLRVRATQAPLNSATVTVQLRDLALDAIGSPITLSYVTDSDGDYLGVIESTVATANSGIAWADLTIVSGSYNDFAREKIKLSYRGF